MFWDFVSQQIPFDQYLDFFIRILMAGICGAVIGIERGHRLKEAGVRTHLLVSCTAALIMIISKYGFHDLGSTEAGAEWGLRGSDPARIAAQVVSGITFLCAGVIFRRGASIKGLTTAAGLWGTAGIGLALGAGMYPMGIFFTVAVVLIQLIMHRVPFLNDRYLNSNIEITVCDDTSFHKDLTDQLRAWSAQIIESSIVHNPDGSTSYSLMIKMNREISQDDINAFLEKHSGVKSFKQTFIG